MTADARIGLSHPGGDMGHDERRTGWRLGVAAAWRALRGDLQRGVRCRECLTVVERLGNEGTSDTQGMNA